MHYLLPAAQIVSIALLISIYWSAAAGYSRLPARIPIHFGLNGQPNQYGGRWTIWLVPAIALLEYAVLTGIVLVHAPVPVSGFLTVIKVEVLALLWYVVREQIKVALAQKQRMGSFIWVLLIVLLGTAFGAPRLIH